VISKFVATTGEWTARWQFVCGLFGNCNNLKFVAVGRKFDDGLVHLVEDESALLHSCDAGAKRSRNYRFSEIVALPDHDRRLFEVASTAGSIKKAVGLVGTLPISDRMAQTAARSQTNVSAAQIALEFCLLPEFMERSREIDQAGIYEMRTEQGSYNGQEVNIVKQWAVGFSGSLGQLETDIVPLLVIDAAHLKSIFGGNCFLNNRGILLNRVLKEFYLLFVFQLQIVVFALWFLVEHRLKTKSRVFGSRNA
jgi:hypothetical protein